MPINFPDAPSSGDTHTVGDKTWTYDGTAWNLVSTASSDHGNLAGLGDDDHTQYLLVDGSRSVSGSIIPDTDVTYDLGSATYRFRDIYLSGSSINLGDIVLSATASGLSVRVGGGGNPNLDFATESYVDTSISSLIGGAPAALDTLNELAAALNDDASYAATITTALAGKIGTTATFGGDVSGTYDNIVISDDSHNHIIGNVDGLQTALDGKLDSSSYTAADVLSKLITVDGAGSSLDADTLDGSHASAFAASSHTHSYAATSHTHSYAATSHTHSYLPLSGGTITGSLMLDSNNGSTPVYIGRYTSSVEAIGIYVLDRDGFIFMNQDETSGASYLHIDNNGAAGSTKRTYFNCNIHVPSVVKSGTSNFQINHPLPEMNGSHWLIHTGIEGPNADNLYRGTVTLVDGTASVNLDTEARMTEGTFVALNRHVQCFTTNETDWGAVKGSVDGNILTITAQDSTSTATVSWMVIGERKDQSIYDSDRSDSDGRALVEIEQDDPSIAPRTFEQAQAEALESAL